MKSFFLTPSIIENDEKREVFVAYLVQMYV